MTGTPPEDGYSAAIELVDELPAFCARGVEHRARISCEQDPAWAEKMRALLTEAGLRDVAHVLNLPLIPATIERPAGFAMTDEAASRLRAHPPQLVFVDGPILSSGASRLGTLDLVKPFIEGDALVLLDDAPRNAELLIAESWSARSDVDVLGIRPQGKGLLEARLHRDSQLNFG